MMVGVELEEVAALVLELGASRIFAPVFENRG